MDPVVPGLAPTSYSVVLPNGSLTLAAGRGDFRVNISPLLNLPGAYRMPGRTAVPPALQNAYVKSIRLGNADVLNGGLRLDRQPDVPLEIVIGTFAGRARRGRAQRKPAAGAERQRRAAARTPRGVRGSICSRARDRTPPAGSASRACRRATMWRSRSTARRTRNGRVPSSWRRTKGAAGPFALSTARRWKLN